MCVYVGWHGNAVFSTVVPQQEGSGFESQLWPFCVDFACACVGSLRALRFRPTVQKACLLGKLINLGVSVSGCVSLR